MPKFHSALIFMYIRQTRHISHSFNFHAHMIEKYNLIIQMILETN